MGVKEHDAASPHSTLSEKAAVRRSEARQRSIRRLVRFGGGTVALILILGWIVFEVFKPPPLMPEMERFISQWNIDPELAIQEFKHERATVNWSRLRASLENYTGSASPLIDLPDLRNAIDTGETRVNLALIPRFGNFRVMGRAYFPFQDASHCRLRAWFRYELLGDWELWHLQVLYGGVPPQ